jgi:hypothetical protein
MPTEVWAPSLSDVARHIPTRTRDTRSPGSDRLLGTFTPDTTPSDGQAQLTIDAAVMGVLARTGPIDPRDAELCAQARVAAEWRASADIEIAYPNRDADIRLFVQLDQRAKDELSNLVERIEQGAGGPAGPGTGVGSPLWKAPPPPPWADRDPDYRWPPGQTPGRPVGAAARYDVPDRDDTPPGGG